MSKPKTPKPKTKVRKSATPKSPTKRLEAKARKTDSALLDHLRKNAGTKPIPDYLKVDEDF